MAQEEKACRQKKSRWRVLGHQMMHTSFVGWQGLRHGFGVWSSREGHEYHGYWERGQVSIRLFSLSDAILLNSDVCLVLQEHVGRMTCSHACHTKHDARTSAVSRTRVFAAARWWRLLVCACGNIVSFLRGLYLPLRPLPFLSLPIPCPPLICLREQGPL
jgi:hypothetical protein